MHSRQLAWLPSAEPWRARLSALSDAPDRWDACVALANTRLDFVRTNALDETVRRLALEPQGGASPPPVRVALLGASTLSHLHAGIRVAGLRRGIRIVTIETGYGQYQQELVDPAGSLHAFRPDVVLFAFDMPHLTQGLHAAAPPAVVDEIFETAMARIGQCWKRAADAFGCQVIQQTVLDTAPCMLGGNEHRLAGSRGRFVVRLNEALRRAADTNGVDILALDAAAARDGLHAWHDPALWHRSQAGGDAGARAHLWRTGRAG